MCCCTRSAVLIHRPIDGTSVNFVRQPSNWTTVNGSNVLLDCDFDAAADSDFFEWRVFSVIDIGRQIYSVSSSGFRPDSRFPNDTYQRKGNYGLLISSVDWRHGATYQCAMLAADIHAVANVVVIGETEVPWCERRYKYRPAMRGPDCGSSWYVGSVPRF